MGKGKTSIYFTEYNENTAHEVISFLERNFSVMKKGRSNIIKELFYVIIVGRHPEIAQYLKDKVTWFKIDYLELD